MEVRGATTQSIRYWRMDDLPAEHEDHADVHRAIRLDAPVPQFGALDGNEKAPASQIDSYESNRATIATQS